MSWLSWYYKRRKYRVKGNWTNQKKEIIHYDKRKFIAYQNPGVFDADFNTPLNEWGKKQSWWKRFLAKFSRKRKKQEYMDEYDKGVERVRNLINK